VKKNYGSAIADAGFYIGTSSSKSKATKYSFDDYGPSSIVNNGKMTMNVTGLESDTKYYYWAYAENGVDETTSSYKTFRTEEDTGTLSLSKTSINWGYGVGNEENVTVTYNGSYSYSIKYDVPADVKNSEYNYEWLDVVKSGSNLNIRPDRANYAATARSATITVTSNGYSKDITVTQAKCGETAPTITLTRGNTVYSNGGVIGSYDLPQENMEVWVSANNIRKLTAHLSPVTGGAIKTCTTTGHISFDISDLSAGEYMITIYASNSNTSNDYWSQSPFSNGVLTLYFILNGNVSSGGSSSEICLTNEHKGKIIDKHEEYIIEAIKYHISNNAYVIEDLNAGRCVTFLFDGCSSNIGTACKNGYNHFYNSKGAEAWYNNSAVCVVVQGKIGEEKIVFLSNDATTMADNVRSTLGDSRGAMLVKDGIYSAITFNHLGYVNDQYRFKGKGGDLISDSIIVGDGKCNNFSEIYEAMLMSRPLVLNLLNDYKEQLEKEKSSPSIGRIDYKSTVLFGKLQDMNLAPYTHNLSFLELPILYKATAGKNVRSDDESLNMVRHMIDFIHEYLSEFYSDAHDRIPYFVQWMHEQIKLMYHNLRNNYSEILANPINDLLVRRIKEEVKSRIEDCEFSCQECDKYIKEFLDDYAKGFPEEKAEELPTPAPAANA